MPHRRAWLGPELGALVASVTLVTACSDSPGEPGPEPGTWYGEVGAIVRTHCAGCHHPGGIAPFSLQDYGDAVEQMGRMVAAIDDGIMPPWYVDDPPDCTPRLPWRDDARLTDAERAAIHAWVDAGGPEGTVRPLPDIQSTSLDHPTVTVAPNEPFVSNGLLDQFACFLYDPRIIDAGWVVGSQVTPSAPELVHHVNVYLIGPGQVDAAIAFTGGLGVAKLQCDHPPGLAIQSWLPGNPALKLPADVGIPVAAGTHVLLQVHYHPAGVGGPDATSLALRLTNTRPAWRFDLGVYGNSPGAPNLQPGPGDPTSEPTFLIPANSPDHVERMLMTHRIDQRPLHVLSVTPHMHLLGTHERATLTHIDGTTECLVDSRWKFDWQRTYTYDAPTIEELPVFDASSTVDLSCHWDNSFANPEMTRLLADIGRAAPYDVSLGVTTSDEMCLADFGLLSPY